MNCDDFEIRMQRAIDARRNLSSQDDLLGHAEVCNNCARDLETWIEVQGLYPIEPATPQRKGRENPSRSEIGRSGIGTKHSDAASPVQVSGSGDVELPAGIEAEHVSPLGVNVSFAQTAVGAVAIIALVIFLFFPQRGEHGGVFQIASSDRTQLELQPVEEPLLEGETAQLSEQWWEMVQDPNWVQKTMPAVRPIRNGVAPLGRSLRQAVAILTYSSNNSTS